eukprot:6199274-Pleurochrysis_carterae.AAC.1
MSFACGCQVESPWRCVYLISSNGTPVRIYWVNNPREESGMPLPTGKTLGYDASYGNAPRRTCFATSSCNAAKVESAGRVTLKRGLPSIVTMQVSISEPTSDDAASMIAKQECAIPGMRVRGTAGGPRAVAGSRRGSGTRFRTRGGVNASSLS